MLRNCEATELHTDAIKNAYTVPKRKTTFPINANILRLIIYYFYSQIEN
jgi:hypothetical protein